MKNKKKFIIGGVLVLILISLVVLCFVLFRNKAINDENSNKIVSKNNYIGYSYVTEGKVNYYISNGEKFIAFNKETNDKVAEFEIPSYKFYEIIGTGSDIIKYYAYKDENDNMYKLFNTDGSLLKSSKDVIQVSNDLHNNKSYYIYDNSLYGDNGELVYKDILKSSKINKEYQFYIYGSYLLVYDSNNYKLLNIKTKETIEVDYFLEQDNYVEIRNKESFYLIDLNKDELIKFNDYNEKPYGIILSDNKGDKKIFTNQQLLNYNDKMSYYDYKFDFVTCDNGFKIYSNKDELISEECYTQFQVDTYDNVFVSKDSKNFYLKDNKMYNYIPIGRYFIKEYGIRNVVVYNDKEEQVNNLCSNEFSYYKNDFYVCNDSKNVYLVDDNFNKISDDYDEMICSDTYCQILKDNKYGLLYDNEVVIEPVYSWILVRDKFIIAEDEYKLDIFTIGEDKFLPDNELYTKIDEYKNINVEQVIEEYELESIEDVIKDNKELFQKYAYVVLNNNGIKDYKEYVLKTFVEVALNKEYLDEKYFLTSLKKLSIMEEDALKENVAGIYYPVGTPNIKLLSSLRKDNILDNTIYHELTHFVDDRLNRSNSLVGMVIYEYQNKYISENDYLELSLKEQESAKRLGEIYYNFLVEGGAEVNSGIYLDNMSIDSYGTQVTFYNMLSYIYGSDTMRNVFFGSEGRFLLFKKMVDAGYTFDEIKKFADITNINYARKSNELMYCVDMIITLYEKEKGGKWYEDKEFSYFVSFVLPYNLKKSDTNRYDEYKKIEVGSSYISEKIYKEFDNIKYVSSSVGIYHKDTIYLTLNVNRIDEDKFKDEVWSIIYDFENDKIKEYKILEE